MRVGGVGANKRLGEMLVIMCLEGGQVLLPCEEVHGGQRLHDRLYRPHNDEERDQDAAGGVQGEAGYRTDDVPVTWG